MHVEKRGCLETYSSVSGFKRTVFELLGQEFIESRLRYLSFNDVKGEHIAEAAIKGDILAQKAFERTGETLGVGLANVVVLFDPELIILAGGLAKAGELLLKPTKKAWRNNFLVFLKISLE